LPGPLGPGKVVYLQQPPPQQQVSGPVQVLQQAIAQQESAREDETVIEVPAKALTAKDSTRAAMMFFSIDFS
jgi:hypothetical protein